MYLDSHCHITCDELYENIDEVIENAKNAGVRRMLVMCTSPEELARALPLKQRDPETFKVAFGWFPSDAKEVTQEKLDWLEEIAMNHQIDVLGEIGLDYYWDKSFKEEQKDLFKKQLEIANKAGLPVSIHMRDAAKDTLDILRDHAKTKIIFHCFSGSTETMKEALKLDSLISFAGPITFKNNKTGPANVIACPIDRILSETDSPYLAPVPKRGKRNEPAFVKYTADHIAALKELDPDDVQKQIEQNYATLFQ